MNFRRRPPSLTNDEFARLYEKHLDAVFNYCLFHTGDRQLAEDLTADAFERAWRHRRRYDPEQASFTTWLFALAKHRLIDQRRRIARRLLANPDGQSEIQPRLPEEEVAREARFTRLRELVQALPDEHRELIALKFGAGLSNRRIAELLNKNESAVGSMIYRLMRKLRQQWEVENV